MFSITKGMFRIATIGLVSFVVIGGAAALIAGPQRAKAVFHRLQDEVHTTIDKAIDDPTALRAQLEELEAEYPARITQVRGDLAELREQIRQLRREQAISERVVSMADQDLAVLEPAIEVASAKRAAGEVRFAAVRFDDGILSFDRAQAKVAQVRNTRLAYGDRASDAAHDLVYLEDQAQRLEELLIDLENERAQFQAQLAMLERQVDAIARNERLIGLLEKRNKTIEECSRYEGVSLDHLTGRLQEIRSRQDAELEFLTTRQEVQDYEDLARYELQKEALGFEALPLGSEDGTVSSGKLTVYGD